MFVVSIIYFIEWIATGRGGARGSNCSLKFRGNMNESGPAGIEVLRVFGPNSVYSCLGPLVVHL